MSKQLDCDIAIVGAGPAGLIAAASLAMTGKNHNYIGVAFFRFC